ncbi:MAG: hypothetical protein GF384_09155, partial [Elusimicrobia bacterium]|nr:hypothetical protein [Elusimicrobiota bacterium]MBD3412752.1 hypothetical protein [Elusimicrobiota bacterium]
YLPSLYGISLSLSEEIAFAKKLGADVSFFLYGGCARGEIRGDRITPLASQARYYGVLIYPRFACSTKEIYEHMKVKKTLTNRENIHIIMKSLHDGKRINTWARYLNNDLEQTAFRLYPRLSAVKKALLRCGSEFVVMSGSGSSLLTLCSTIGRAQSMLQAVQRSKELKRMHFVLFRPISGFIHLPNR